MWDPASASIFAIINNKVPIKYTYNVLSKKVQLGYITVRSKA